MTNFQYMSKNPVRMADILKEILDHCHDWSCEGCPLNKVRPSEVPCVSHDNILNFLYSEKEEN